MSSIDSTKRLQSPIALHWNHYIEVGAKTQEMRQQPSGDKRLIASHDDCPVGLAGRECGVEAAERSPLFVNIENSRKLGLNVRVTSSDHGDRVRNRGQGGRNALNESLPAEHKL